MNITEANAWNRGTEKKSQKKREGTYEADAGIGGKRMCIRPYRLAVLLGLLMVGVVLMLQPVSASAAETPIRVMVDGSDQPLRLDVDPVSRQGTTLVQMRPLFEKLGMKLTWNASSQTVNASKAGTQLTLKIGSKTATVNGRQVPLDYPASAIGGSTMVPLRFVGEATGAVVHWNGAGREVVILTTDWLSRNNVTAAQMKKSLIEKQAEFDAQHAKQKAAEQAAADQQNAPSLSTQKANLNNLSGMYFGHTFDYGGYECGGTCWHFYTFLPNKKVVTGLPAGGGPEKVNCGTDKCRSYTISNGKLNIQGEKPVPISVDKAGLLNIGDVTLKRPIAASSGKQLSGEYSYQAFNGLKGTYLFNWTFRDMVTFSGSRFTTDQSTLASLRSGKIPPDSASEDEVVIGTYAIKDHTITFTYSNGRKESFFYDLQRSNQDNIVYLQIGGRSLYIGGK